MFASLLPREHGFFDQFEEHAGFTAAAARRLQEILEDPTALAEGTAEVKQLERNADAVFRACVQALHQTFITPLERGDIHRLITRLDSVADHIDGVARRLAAYRVQDPPPELVRMGELLVEATATLVAAFPDLRELKAPARVLDACRTLVRLEEQSDILYAAGLGRLFQAGADPLEVIKIQELLATAESALDACEGVGEVLEGVVLEHV